MPEENLYQRGGIWWLRAVIAGKKYRESLRTSDVKVARKIRDKRIAEIKGESFHGEERITWANAVLEWIAHAADQLAPKTKTRYGVSLLQCKPHLAKYAIHEINGKVIQAVIRARRAEGATPATVRRDLTAISQVMTYAEAMEWREGNPTLTARRTLKERRDPITLPTDHDIEAVLREADTRFAALIKAAELTGCRQDELVRARRRQFSDNARTLTVIGKGNKRRTISLSDEAWTHIRTQPPTLGSDLIFCGEGGVPFDTASQKFANLRDKVAKMHADTTTPVQRFRFHDLRHLYAVRALQGGMSIYTLSKQLGHTSVKTTEIYLEFLTPEQQEVAKGLGTKPDTTSTVLPSNVAKLRISSK